MADEREVSLRITATDDASRTVDDVADALDQLDDVDVDVDADTRDARSNVERLADELDGLSDDTRELRILFRAEQLQREIRNALRDLERLDDPVEIQARTADLETARRELVELSELAARDYSVEIDVDPQRNAARAAGDIDSIRARGEGLQSALPALRGFTDELGETSQAAGVAGQAVGDLGDFALILGERFGVSEGITTRLGTALGAAGLATVLLGVAVPALQKLTGAQDDNRVSAEDLLGVQEKLRDNRYDEAAAELVDLYGDLIAEGESYGATLEQIADYLLGNTTAIGSFGDVTDESTDATSRWVRELAVARTEIGLAGVDVRRTDARVDAFSRTMSGAENDTADAADMMALYRDRVNEANREAADATDTFDDMRAALDVERSVLRAADAFDRALSSIAEAGEATRSDVIDLQLAVLDFADAAENVPPAAITEVQALVDEGSFNVARARLAALTARETKVVDVVVREDEIPPWLRPTISRPGPRFSAPGILGPDGDPLTRAAGAGPVLGVTAGAGMVVNVRTTASMREVDRAIRRWHRVNGGR